MFVITDYSVEAETKHIDLAIAGPSTAISDLEASVALDVSTCALPEPSQNTTAVNCETPKIGNQRVRKAPVIQPRKRKYLNEITDAFINRKSKKNNEDDLQLNKKILILNSEKEHKLKKMEHSEMLFNKQMEILELEKNCKLQQSIKQMEILELEKQIKEAELKIKLKELQKYT